MSMLQDETLITFGEAPDWLPRIGGKRVSPSTIWRWGCRGIKGVRLDCLRIGNQYVTSVEALERFTQALRVAKSDPPYTTAEKRQPVDVRPRKQNIPGWAQAGKEGSDDA
jgi:hypothetical protein